MRIHTNGNVGIGTPTPKNRLDVEGGAVIGATYSGTRTAPEDGLLVQGNVGIGTPAEPKAKLEVFGGAIMPAAGKSESAGILFPKDPGGGGGDAAWIRYYPRSGEATTFEIGTSNDKNDHIVLMPSGNVGIGTPEPKAKLHINGSVRGNLSGALRIDTGVGYVDIGPKNTGWSHFYTDRPSYYFNKEIRVDSGFIGSYNEDLQLRTQGTTRITIRKANGNVGIGTAQPAGRLDVVSPWGDWIFLRQQRKTEGGGGFHIHNPWKDTDTADRNRLEIGYMTSKGVHKWGQFVIHGPTGNVGIGTVNPRYTLHTNGTSYAKRRAGGGIDYAEYFKSLDGKEIPAGTSVLLDGDKIRPAKKNETPIGIISSNSVIVGGVYTEWPKKYLRDEFGNLIMEEYKEEVMVPKKEKVTGERQKVEKKTIKEEVTRTEIVFEDGK
ncbi:MAG: hypothetical protein KAU03_01125, partial [Candidatus Altiarchaeales archaeon]|nr:hypothetical protein [Candidatus Altiarchaeales archaeon]